MRWLALGLMLAAFSARADVVIEIDTTPPCGPAPVATPTKQEDGTYRQSMIVLAVCTAPEKSSRKEVWTDYPEKGGKYISQWIDPNAFNAVNSR